VRSLSGMADRSQDPRAAGCTAAYFFRSCTEEGRCRIGGGPERLQPFNAVLDRRTASKPSGLSTVKPQNSCVSNSHAVGRSSVVRRMQLPMSSRQLLDTQSGIGGNSTEVAM